MHACKNALRARKNTFYVYTPACFVQHVLQHAPTCDDKWIQTHQKGEDAHMQKTPQAYIERAKDPLSHSKPHSTLYKAH